MDDCLLTRAKLDKHVSQLVQHWYMDYPLQLGHAIIVLLTSINIYQLQIICQFLLIAYWHLYWQFLCLPWSRILCQLDFWWFLSSHEPAVIRPTFIINQVDQRKGFRCVARTCEQQHSFNCPCLAGTAIPYSVVMRVGNVDQNRFLYYQNQLCDMVWHGRTVLPRPNRVPGISRYCATDSIGRLCFLHHSARFQLSRLPQPEDFEALRAEGKALAAPAPWDFLGTWAARRSWCGQWSGGP